MVKIHDSITLSNPTQDMFCDWQLYLHVIYNLFSNAVKHTDKGGEIEILLVLVKDEDDESLQLKTVITNSGSLLPKATVKRMNLELDPSS